MNFCRLITSSVTVKKWKNKKEEKKQSSLLFLVVLNQLPSSTALHPIGRKKFQLPPDFNFFSTFIISHTKSDNNPPRKLSLRNAGINFYMTKMSLLFLYSAAHKPFFARRKKKLHQRCATFTPHKPAGFFVFFKRPNFLFVEAPAATDNS